MLLTRKRWPFFAVGLLLLLAACSQPNNYPDSNQPFFEGSYAESIPQFSGSIKVVSWNTNYGEQLDRIIAALTEEESLQDADVLLLQEMDDVSVDLLAQTLKYNYVYYPATIHHHHEKNFGNTILSPWPLDDPKKIVLPNSDPDSKQDRIAVRANVLIDDLELSAYSVHLEHFWMLPGRSESQVEVLVRQVGKEAHPVIVGGDFNSWSPGSIDLLDTLFGEIDMQRVSKGAAPTLETSVSIPLTVDHIFASDFFESQAGVWQQNEISDHAAVWAILNFDEANYHE